MTDLNQDPNAHALAIISFIYNRIITGAAPALRKQTGLTVTEARIMLHLGMPECNSANELVKNLGLDKAAISRSVSRLTKLGLIVSERDPENGARYILRFTALGRVQSQRIASFTYARESHLLKVLTEGERTLFLASLQKVLKNVEPVNELVAQGRFWD